MPFKEHLEKYENLITSYEATRAGFIALALEKNKKASPFVEEAKVLKVMASRTGTAKDLLKIPEIRNSLITAAGISNKANAHLRPEDETESIRVLIENFLEPAGDAFVDELVYRFLLTRGDSLGGSMRNIAGKLGEWRLIRTLMSTLSIRGTKFKLFDSESKKWRPSNNEPDLERRAKMLTWVSGEKSRVLACNMTLPTVKKNVDLCLFDCSPSEMVLGRKESARHDPTKYLALGELKGGFDPAGADEHWKTANTALERIRIAFSDVGCSPKTFFVGAAIENAMAKEMFAQLKKGTLSNAANLTNEAQVVSLCDWLTKL